jgi:hypothetical protein
MATIPIPVPASPQFGVGLFQANQTFQGLAGYRWSYPTAQALVWGILDTAITTGVTAGTVTSKGGVVLPSGYITAAGEEGLSQATQGMTNTQHAHTAPLVQHAMVLNGLGEAIEAAAAYGLSTRKTIYIHTAPKTIYRYIKPNLKGALAPIYKRLNAADRKATQEAKREKALAAKVARLQRQIQHPHAIAIPGLESDIGRVGKRIGDLEKKVQKLGKIAGLGAFLLLLAKALEKIGGNYIRCRNTKRWGNNICGMNPALLETLLAESALLASGFSLRTLTNQVLSVENEIVAGVKKAVAEIRKVSGVTEGGYAHPADGRH